MIDFYDFQLIEDSSNPQMNSQPQPSQNTNLGFYQINDMFQI